MSRTRLRPVLALIILIFVIGAAASAYLIVGHGASGGSTQIMPLDDVYIHFQYARMIAAGQPFHYNPGDPATSGATSLLYPFILAVGYALGFQGDRLAIWALAIGVLCWIGSAWIVFRLVWDRTPQIHLTPRPPLRHHGEGEPRPWTQLRGQVGGGQTWIALVVAIAFALSGAIGWAFMSGMETGLMILATLLTLWCVTRDRLGAAMLAASLTAVIRPEGAVIALGAIGYFAVWRGRRTFPLAILPIVAIGIQPAINLLLTRSITASGMQAKSYLYNVPFDLRSVIGAIGGVFARIWAEMLTGIDRDGIFFGTTIAAILAAIYFAWQIRQSRTERSSFWLIGMIAFWLIGLSGAASILETAFWQFKRYQQPIVAVLFVLAGWAINRIYRTPRSQIHLTPQPPLRTHGEGESKGAQWVAVGGLAICSLVTLALFLGYYGDNVHEVASLQVPMARFVATNTPLDARIGVHDIGIVRYLGDRATYDVVGLTNSGAARAWRSGPGAVYEQMRGSPIRPSYFAIYTDPHGLSYFDSTDLFRDVLARFPSTRPGHNVASASDEQIVTRADWSIAGRADSPVTTAIPPNFARVDALNVADLSDEDAHSYRWWNTAQKTGYATELYQMATLGCDPAQKPTCSLLDGGRLLTGGEEMTIHTLPGADLLWITRVHPHDEAALKLLVNGQLAATRVIPGGLGGHWLEVATLIPGTLITGAQTRLRVEASRVDGFYMPYYHWFYQGHFQPDMTATLPSSNAGAHFGAAGAGITLLGWRISIEPASHSLRLDVEWLADPGAILGDDKVFIHIYDQPDRPPIAQIDGLPGGTTPPGNWLPGIFHDTYRVPLPAGSATHTLAIGLYDASVPNGDRFVVSSVGATGDGRLFLASFVGDF